MREPQTLLIHSCHYWFLSPLIIMDKKNIGQMAIQYEWFRPSPSLVYFKFSLRRSFNGRVCRRVMKLNRTIFMVSLIWISQLGLNILSCKKCRLENNEKTAFKAGPWHGNCKKKPTCLCFRLDYRSRSGAMPQRTLALADGKLGIAVFV